MIEGDTGLLESGSSISSDRTLLKRKRNELPSVCLPGLGVEIIRQGKARALTVADGNNNDLSAALLGRDHDGSTTTTCDAEEAIGESIFIAEPSGEAVIAQAEAVPEEPQAEVAEAARAEVLDIVAVQAGQDSFDYISPAGHRFHFVFKLNKTSANNMGQWQCTCHYHEPLVLPSGNKTFCTASRSVRTDADHDDSLRWLQHWAQEAENATSKEEHQKVALTACWLF